MEEDLILEFKLLANHCTGEFLACWVGFWEGLQ